MADYKYTLDNPIYYYSERYGHFVVVPLGYRSDGATGARDIDSIGWWVHDFMCDTGTFSTGTPCTNQQASTVLYDILREEGYWFRARSWYLATLLLGGGKARDNGIFKLKTKK